MIMLQFWEMGFSLAGVGTRDEMASIVPDSAALGQFTTVSMTGGGWDAVWRSNSRADAVSAVGSSTERMYRVSRPYGAMSLRPVPGDI